MSWGTWSELSKCTTGPCEGIGTMSKTRTRRKFSRKKEDAPDMAYPEMYQNYGHTKKLTLTQGPYKIFMHDAPNLQAEKWVESCQVIGSCV